MLSAIYNYFMGESREKGVARIVGILKSHREKDSFYNLCDKSYDEFKRTVHEIHEFRRDSLVIEQFDLQFKLDIGATLAVVCTKKDTETLMNLYEIVVGDEFYDRKMNSAFLCAALNQCHYEAVERLIGEDQTFLATDEIFLQLMKIILVSSVIFDICDEEEMFRKFLSVKGIPLTHTVFNRSFEYDLHSITELILDDGRIDPNEMVPHRMNVDDDSFRKLLEHKSSSRITDETIKGVIYGSCVDKNRELAIDFLDKRSK